MVLLTKPIRLFNSLLSSKFLLFNNLAASLMLSIKRLISFCVCWFRVFTAPSNSFMAVTSGDLIVTVSKVEGMAGIGVPNC